MTVAEVVLFWRQAANNFLFIMDLILDGILLLYIRSYFKDYGARLSWEMVRVRAAVWLGVHVMGLTLQRGWGIILLRAIVQGNDVAAVEAHIPLFFLGSIIAAIGLAGTIYTFTPLAGQEGSGRWKRVIPLLLAIGIAAVFTIVMQGV